MQTTLNFHGGYRKGSGRTRLHSKGVAHRAREKVKHYHPLHINFKFRTFIKKKASLRILKRALINARKQGLRIVHFSMQSNHIHLIIEAKDNSVLSSGMRALTVTFAKGLKKGKVQLERYHLHVLKTKRETKHAVHYVMFNQQKHEKGTYTILDEFTSAMTDLKTVKEYAKRMRITIKILGSVILEMDKPTIWMLSNFD